jgi:hypothetical protein
MSEQPNARGGAARPIGAVRGGDSRPLEDVEDRAVEARVVEGRSAMGDSRSVPELLGDLARSIPALVRQEILLLRSELSDKVTQIEVGLGSIVAGGILLFAALLVLLQAIVIALTEFVGPGWAALIVGVIVAAVGAVLLKKGADQMKTTNLMPNRTANQLKQDAELAKEQVR